MPPTTLHRRSNRAAAGWLALALVAIGVATLRPGDPSRAEPTALWCLVCGSFGAIDVVQNVALFVPLGWALRALGTGRLATTLLGLATSLLVEGAQLLVLAGRDPTLSDLLTNTGGTFLGVLLADHWRQVVRPRPTVARALAAAALAGWVAAGAATAWALQPDVPTGIGYWINPVTGESNRTFVPFTGRIADVRLGGAPLGPSRLRDPSALLPRLRERPLVLTAAVLPGPLADRVQLIASVFTFDSRDVALLTRDGHDLRFSVRTRAARLRLRTPVAILPGLFAERTGWVSVGGAEDRESLRVWAEWRGERREARVPRTPHLGWALIAPLAVPLGRWTVALSAAWLAAPLLLAAYWGALGAPARPARALALLVPTVGAALVLVPLVAGLAAPRWWEWIAATAALAGGWLVGRAKVRGDLAPAARAGENCPS